MENNNRLMFEQLEQVTPDAVKWLKAGSYKQGGYIYNRRVIYYTTKRGKAKGITDNYH